MRKVLSRIRSAISILRTTWALLGLTLVMLLVTEEGLRLIFWLKDLRNIPASPDEGVIAAGYGGERWPVDHYQELLQIGDRWEPFVYFRQKPFSGKTIHVDAEGRRAVWSPREPARSGRPVRLYFLGGSALWGFGARDDHTIPSYVVQDLDRRGTRVEVTNLSEIGYVNTQEMIDLIRALRHGERPDFVIFYDGVNDTTSALLDGVAGVSTNESNRRREFNLLQSPKGLATNFFGHLIKESASLRFAQAVRRRSGAADDARHPAPEASDRGRLADDVVRCYRANLKMIRNLGEAYGFQPLFFWQPTVFNKPRLVPFEAEEKLNYAWTEPLFRDVYKRVRDSSELKGDSSFHDLSPLFEAESELVFIDYCHTTEAGNARIAAPIADALAKAIEARAKGAK